MEDNFYDAIRRAEQRKRKFNEQIEFYFTEIFAWASEGASDWAENFDTSFVESLWAQYKKDGKLSEKQSLALQNIYETWVCI